MNAETKNPSEAVVTMRFQELHTSFWEALSAFFKGSSLALGIYAVGLGYLLKVPLSPLQARPASFSIIVILALWYVSCLRLLKLYRLLTDQIEETTLALHLPYEPRTYRSLKEVIVAGMSAFLPPVLVLLYFTISPPTVITPSRNEEDCRTSTARYGTPPPVSAGDMRYHR